MFIDLVNIPKYKNSRKYKEPMRLFSKNTNIENSLKGSRLKDYLSQTICEWIISAVPDNLPLVRMRARV